MVSFKENGLLEYTHGRKPDCFSLSGCLVLFVLDRNVRNGRMCRQWKATTAVL